MTIQEIGLSLDTVWMLLAAMLVFFMQPGFALCEAFCVPLVCFRHSNTKLIYCK